MALTLTAHFKPLAAQLHKENYPSTHSVSGKQQRFLLQPYRHCSFSQPTEKETRRKANDHASDLMLKQIMCGLQGSSQLLPKIRVNVSKNFISKSDFHGNHQLGQVVFFSQAGNQGCQFPLLPTSSQTSKSGVVFPVTQHEHATIMVIFSFSFSFFNIYTYYTLPAYQLASYNHLCYDH